MVSADYVGVTHRASSYPWLLCNIQRGWWDNLGSGHWTTFYLKHMLWNDFWTHHGYNIRWVCQVYHVDKEKIHSLNIKQFNWRGNRLLKVHQETNLQPAHIRFTEKSGFRLTGLQGLQPSNGMVPMHASGNWMAGLQPQGHKDKIIQEVSWYLHFEILRPASAGEF